MNETGAIEEHVNRWHASHGARNGSLVEHIEHRGLDAGNAGIARQQRWIHVGRPDNGALPGHGQRAGLANALASGRDENGFSFEFHGML